MTEAEFEAVFREHKDAVYRFAWRMTSSPATAEDIAQEVFLSLLRHPDRFDPARGTLRPFLLGIARNLALKRWRTESRWENMKPESASRHGRSPSGWAPPIGRSPSCEIESGDFAH